MRQGRLSGRAVVVTCLLAALGAARAWSTDDAGATAYFPLEVGRSWTYNLRITTGQQTRTIEYTTRIARVDDVSGVPCAVFEDHSGERLLQVNWYALDAASGAIVQPQRQTRGVVGVLCARQGERVGAPGRVLLTGEAVAALPGKTSWEWASSDGSSRGTVTLVGREKLRLRNHGELDCLVLVDEGTSSSGGRTARIERKVWLASGIGCVQERTTISAGDATTESEATLIRHD
ncbi:MAG: hypothetical protein KF878_20680 [Planctomycetes bacterium]|nr:hypothetical protein [Planctomycetota bacterium]MCW8141347.1 hypothetical protein [Planctomycetota bacterium]